MAILMQRAGTPSPFASPLALALTLALGLAGYGCVFEEKCVGAGVSRGADGKCRATGPDTDAGPIDGGARDGGGTPFDAGDVDSGPGGDAGPPDDAGPVETVVEIAAGSAHVCARTNFGSLFCRGNNSEGQLATGSVTPAVGPVLVAFDQPVLRLTGAHVTVCALTGRPAAYCWGGNTNGQVGTGGVGGQVTTPAELGGVGSLATMASSFANTCITSTGGGNTQCWGRNDKGQLGFDSGMADVTGPGTEVGTDSGGMTRPLQFVTETVIGDRHICFLTATPEVYCVGENARGQLGYAGPDSSLAVLVSGLTSVRSISAADMHTCAVSGDSVYCWGNNEKGQVDPTSPSMAVTTPTLVAGVSGARQVVTGMETSCALLTTGEVVCWGARMHGGIGDGSADTSIATPTTVALITDTRQLSANFVWLTCALSNSGVVSCWGTDAVSLLGGGTSSAIFPDGLTMHEAPAEVPMLP